MEKNTTRSDMGGSKDSPQACRQRKEILGERITRTCMEVLIRNEWIRLEEATGTVTTMSGIVVVAEEDGQFTTNDGTFVWKKPSRTGEAEPSTMEEGSGFLY